MNFKHLLLFGAFALTCSQAMATIVGGVRVKPEPVSTGFQTDVEAYLYNVDAQQYFCAGNAYGTQASTGATGLLTKFVSNGDGSYFFQDYFRNKWMYTFIQSTTTMYVDRASQANYYWAVENNGDTFRLYPSTKNPDYYDDMYGSGYYMGLNIAENAGNTALVPYLKAGEAGHCVDWVLITPDALAAVATELALYEKAQELKVYIDKITAKGGNADALKIIYENEASTMEQLESAITDAKSLFVQTLINTAADPENVDLTELIVNPDYETGNMNGWSETHTTGGSFVVAGSSANKCFEAWNTASFDVHQTVNNLPVGVYEIEVQGFYRYLRDNNAWNAYKNQTVDYVKKGAAPVYVYMNQSQTPFVNIFDEPVPVGSVYTTETTYMYPSAMQPFQDGAGNWYPNEMYNSALAFSTGMYKQSAFGLVATDGEDFTVGVKGSSNQGNDSWVIWDNFKLYYRGFKPEVVKPVLEQAVADISVYAGMPMGKTEYAAMSAALEAAAQAIENNDGTAMFNALNTIYAVKSSVQASKDLFAENFVADSIASLEAAISAVAEAKLSAATLSAANSLLASLKNNSVYENASVGEIAATVLTQKENLQNSVALYAALNEAVTTLSANTSVKAYKALLTQAAELMAAATKGYNEGSLADANVQAMIDNILTLNTGILASEENYSNLKSELEKLQPVLANKANKDTLASAQTCYDEALQAYNQATIADEQIAETIEEIQARLAAVNASTALYVGLNDAIVRLKTAIDEVSDETQHVSKTTLSQANDLYTASVTAYNNGTVADTRIAARISAIDETITTLTKSLNLYKALNTAIAGLQEVMDEAADKKMSAAIRSTATTMLTEAVEAYAEGSYADDEIESKTSGLNNMKEQVTASVSQYVSLNTAIADFTTVIDGLKDKKMSAAVKTAAQELLTTVTTGYNEGSFSDQEAASQIASMTEITAQLNASVNAYNTLADAIADLEPIVEKKANKNALDAAKQLLATAKTGYENGLLADSEIEELVANMASSIESVNASAEIYVGLAEALTRLNNAITEASAETEHVSASTLSQAQDLYNASLAAYNDGTIADNRMASRINVIDEQITNLMQSINFYKDFAEAIADLESAVASMGSKKLAAATLADATTLLSNAKNAYAAGTINDDQVAAQINTLNAMINTLNSSVAGYAELDAALVELAGEIEEAVANGVADELINQATGIKDEYQGKYDAGSIADADMADAVARVKGMTAELEADIERILTAVKARMAAAENQGDTYTVGGQKVVGKQKGLVIRNGRKVVVK